MNCKDRIKTAIQELDERGLFKVGSVSMCNVEHDKMCRQIPCSCNPKIIINANRTIFSVGLSGEVKKEGVIQ